MTFGYTTLILKWAHTVSVKTCMAARARALRGYSTYDVYTEGAMFMYPREKM